MTKLIVAFRSFANSAKNGLIGLLSVEIIAINGNNGMKNRVTGANMLVNGEVRQVNCGERGDVQSFAGIV